MSIGYVEPLVILFKQRLHVYDQVRRKRLVADEDGKAIAQRWCSLKSLKYMVSFLSWFAFYNFQSAVCILHIV